MKKLLKFIALSVYLSALMPLHARDFTYTYEGQTITYTVLDEEAKTCATKAGGYDEIEDKDFTGNTVSGALVLPANPKDGDVEYTLTEIGEYAFYECRDINSVIIPNTVTEIKDLAFFDVESLNSINIPYSVKKIGRLAFSGAGLTSIVIPNSVTEFGEYAFLGCSSLTKAEFASIEHLCSINFSDYTSNPLFYAKHLYINGEEIKDLVIPNSVTKIGENAFIGCGGLTSVTISNSVTEIGGGAFEKCSNMTSVTIPNSVTKIGDRAFYWCHGLTSITIPNSVTEIGEKAFVECRFTSISIPESVTKIGSQAFLFCRNLTKAEFVSFEALYNIQFEDGASNPLYCAQHLFVAGEEITEIVIPDTVTEIGTATFAGGVFLTSITIPNSVTKIGDVAFDYCSGLTSITIPNSVTSIGYAAFWECLGLTSIDIPNSVTEIGEDAFYRCYGLTSITIPNSVTKLGESAFHGCYDLTSVYYNAQNPIASDEYLFSNYSATLYVPKGAVDTFKATTPWNKFNKIEEYDFGGVTDVIADKSGEIDYTHPYEIYNFNGAKVGNNKDTLSPGLYIIRQGTTTKKISVQ